MSKRQSAFPELGERVHTVTPRYPSSLLGIHRDMEPPDPISNSEVKRVIADGSVGPPHVRVGQCQAPIQSLPLNVEGFFIGSSYKSSA